MASQNLRRRVWSLLFTARFRRRRFSELRILFLALGRLGISYLLPPNVLFLRLQGFHSQVRRIIIPEQVSRQNKKVPS